MRARSPRCHWLHHVGDINLNARVLHALGLPECVWGSVVRAVGQSFAAVIGS